MDRGDGLLAQEIRTFYIKKKYLHVQTARMNDPGCFFPVVPGGAQGLQQRKLSTSRAHSVLALARLSEAVWVLLSPSSGSV